MQRKMKKRHVKCCVLNKNIWRTKKTMEMIRFSVCIFTSVAGATAADDGERVERREREESIHFIFKFRKHTQCRLDSETHRPTVKNQHAHWLCNAILRFAFGCFRFMPEERESSLWDRSTYWNVISIDYDLTIDPFISVTAAQVYKYGGRVSGAKWRSQTRTRCRVNSTRLAALVRLSARSTVNYLWPLCLSTANARRCCVVSSSRNCWHDVMAIGSSKSNPNTSDLLIYMFTIHHLLCIYRISFPSCTVSVSFNRHRRCRCERARARAQTLHFIPTIAIRMHHI